MGSKHSLALKRDGTVWQWGQASSPQGGAAKTPTRIELSPIKEIYAAGDLNAAVGVKGELWFWKNGKKPTMAASSTWGQPAADIVAVAMNPYGPVGLDRHGVVWQWDRISEGNSSYPNKMELPPIRALTRDGNAISLEKGEVWYWSVPSSANVHANLSDVVEMAGDYALTKNGEIYHRDYSSGEPPAPIPGIGNQGSLNIDAPWQDDACQSRATRQSGTLVLEAVCVNFQGRDYTGRLEFAPEVKSGFYFKLIDLK